MSVQSEQYLRKYRVIVKLPQADGSTEVISVSDSDLGTEALRVTFDIYTPAFQAYWYADITIYNLDALTTFKILDAATSQEPLKQGMQVTVEAGYQNGKFNLIWSGTVLQPQWGRESITEFTLNLHCVIGLNEDARNFINTNYSTGASQLDVVRGMAAKTLYPLAVDPKNIAALNPKQSVRGITVFGKPGKFLSQISDDNNMTWWLDQKGINMSSPLSGVVSDDEAIVVSSPVPGSKQPPTQGTIIGTPMQTQWGVNLTVLLDPSISVQQRFQKIRIDNSLLRLQKFTIGVRPGILDPDATYVVGAVRYVGDTRGTPWYCEIIGYTLVSDIIALVEGNLKTNTSRPR